MRHGGFHVLHHLHRANQIKIFSRPVRFHRRHNPGQNAAGLGASPKFHPGFVKRSLHERQKRFRLRPIDQQGLHGVADTGSLDLGIEAYLPGHIKIRPIVHVDVTHPLVMLQNRDPGILNHKPDEPFTAPGNNKINIFFLGKQRVLRRTGPAWAPPAPPSRKARHREALPRFSRARTWLE